jgi:hypothetical protein
LTGSVSSVPMGKAALLVLRELGKMAQKEDSLPRWFTYRTGKPGWCVGAEGQGGGGGAVGFREW